MSNRKKNSERKLKDLPYSLERQVWRFFWCWTRNYYDWKRFFCGNKVGIGGALIKDKNSGDFISDYIEIKETLKNLTENNSRVVLHRLQRKGLIEKRIMNVN